MDKDKKKNTYYIYKFKKKIDTKDDFFWRKKTFSVEKKRTFKQKNPLTDKIVAPNIDPNKDLKRKNFVVKFVENNKLQKIL